MKVTDEIVEAVLEDHPWLPAEALKRILTTFTRILSTREPDDELVERVAKAIGKADCMYVSPEMARAAIKAVWGES